jgi:DNA-binding NarL/FixJ family response regulator
VLKCSPGSAEQTGEGGTRMTTVLVCDDAPLAREAVRRAVASVPGVDRVSAAGSGEEVLARYPLERPNVVLMDVRMPGMGGVEATRRLMATYPGAVVVMLTMGEDIEGVAAAVAVGARGYMVKDASREETATMLSLAATPPVHRSGNVVALPLRPMAGGPSLSGRELEVLESGALPLRGHGQDPRTPDVPQDGGRGPGPGRRAGVPRGPAELTGLRAGLGGTAVPIP